MDRNNAHVQPGGLYHYHGIPLGMVERWPADDHSKLVGWAADGFPIYALIGYADPADPGQGVRKLTASYRIKQGQRPGGSEGPGGAYDGSFTRDWEYVPGHGDLDAFNGRFTVTPEFPGGTYAYFLTWEYPFVPRRFKGTPDQSFLQRPRGGRRGNAPMGPAARMFSGRG